MPSGEWGKLVFTKVKRLSALVGAGAALALCATPASASEAIPHIDQNAVRASVQAHGGVLTQAEAVRLGIKPNTQYLDTPLAGKIHRKLASGARTGSTAGVVASPRNASGCNGEVCIEVTGSGLHVSTWSTFAYTNGYQCSYGAFWEDGDLAGTGPQECNDGIVWNSTGDLDFGGTTQICNTWVGISGRPCETVHG